MMNKAKQLQVLIIGGGAAGISVASSLKRRVGSRSINITIVEPSEIHYYQPAFTLVGAGAYPFSKTCRKERSIIPDGVNWLQDSAVAFDPENNRVIMVSGKMQHYDYLVVCPGLTLNWSAIDGAEQALGKNGVCSNYSPHHVEYTWACLQKLKAGDTALFTQPPLPFKCPGAPQKIAYLAADHLRKKGLLAQCRLHFLNHGPAMFGVPFFARELDKVAARYGIHVHFQANLIAVDGDAKRATFELVGAERSGEVITLDFDMLHISPPQRSPQFVRDSVLANDAGYVEVHQHSMQQVKYPNIFGLGDACSTPNSKTAAAIRKQSPVVVQNILRLIDGETVAEGYDGYGSCPLTTAYGKVLLAEFTYGGKVTPTLPLDPRKERASMWWVKKTGLPAMYWDYMLRGREWFLEHNTAFAEPQD